MSTSISKTTSCFRDRSTESNVTTYPARPAHPERICWGCDRRCPAADLACGEDKERAPHPIELFGDDWTAT